ncbi:hypothetical protein BC829DRAFT_28540 [Chytridium lagenaria]|nr:hypothetical protein BC829DRAFT_28540 [Chytridium lagenaria]
MNFVDECYIFRKGDPGNDLFIIKIGQVEIVDGEKILVVLQEGACFGEVALYKGKHNRDSFCCRELWLTFMGNSMYTYGVCTCSRKSGTVRS